MIKGKSQMMKRWRLEKKKADFLKALDEEPPFDKVEGTGMCLAVC